MKLKSLLGLLVLSSCEVFAPQSSGGQGGEYCGLKTSDLIFGQWKMIKGYNMNPQPSMSSLQSHYDQLIIEFGSRMCSTRIINYSPNAVVYKADYEHMVDDRELLIEVTSGQNNHASSSRAKYSFTGTCDVGELTLNLRYDDGKTEQYLLLAGSQMASPGLCDPSEE